MKQYSKDIIQHKLNKLVRDTKVVAKGDEGKTWIETRKGDVITRKPVKQGVK